MIFFVYVLQTERRKERILNDVLKSTHLRRFHKAAAVTVSLAETCCSVRSVSVASEPSLD
jgi:hypothetical protein